MIETEKENQHITKTLNHLIAMGLDSQIGYLQAAQDITAPRLAAAFRDYAWQREQFVVELSNLVVSLSGEPSHSRLAATNRYIASVLDRCIQSEDAACLAYKVALKQSLPNYVQKVLHSQYQQIRQIHERLCALRDAQQI